MRTRTSKDCCTCAVLLKFAGVVGWVFLLVLLPGIENAHAATLTVSNVEDIRAGDTAVEVPMALSNDGGNASIGGVQMDVAYEPAVLTLSTVKSGAASQDAGKNVSFNVVSEGVVRIIIAGLNQKAIADGVIAALVFSVAATAPAGAYPVAMTVAQMVSPTGVQVTGSTVPGTVTIAAAVEGEPGAEGESTTPSGCSGGTLATPSDPGNPGTGILLAVCFLMICFGASRRGQRQIPR